MTNQSPRIYTYKITFEEVPHYYYGVHKEDKFDEYYMGSPVTHKWMWDFYTPQKQVLELFDYSDEGYTEAEKVEKRLIRPVFNTDPLCLNENCGGRISLEACRKAGRMVYELGLGVHKMTPEELSAAASKGGKKAKEMGVGVHNIPPERRTEISRRVGRLAVENKTGIHNLSPERRSEIGKKNGAVVGKRHKENGTGIFKLSEEEKLENCKKGGKVAGEMHKQNGTGVCGLTSEERIENGRKGGLITYEKGVGFHALTSEQKSEVGKRGGQSAYEKGAGFHAWTKEQKSENGRKRAKILHSQKWQCTVTGFVTNAGSLTLYQKARGIDTSNRIRIQ
jgi:general stress protein YciG